MKLHFKRLLFRNGKMIKRIIGIEVIVYLAKYTLKIGNEQFQVVASFNCYFMHGNNNNIIANDNNVECMKWNKRVHSHDSSLNKNSISSYEICVCIAATLKQTTTQLVPHTARLNCLCIENWFCIIFSMCHSIYICMFCPSNYSLRAICSYPTMHYLCSFNSIVRSRWIQPICKINSYCIH